jgi:hypothetical protein
MIDGIEEFYPILAESMSAAIPEEWSSASYEAFYFPQSSVYVAEYVRAVDGKLRSFTPTGEGGRAFRRLRKLFKEAGKPLWGKATFELQSNGKFNLHFSYDNCDADGNMSMDDDWHTRLHQERMARYSP